MRVSITNKFGKLAEQLEQTKKKLESRMPLALREAGKLLLDESLVLVPQDTKTLKESGRVAESGSGFGRVIYVGYGGDDLPVRTVYSPNEGKMVQRDASAYAVFVHEGGAKMHELRSGQTDFLRQPVNDALVQDAMRKEINDVVTR